MSEKTAKDLHLELLIKYDLALKEVSQKLLDAQEEINQLKKAHENQENKEFRNSLIETMYTSQFCSSKKSVIIKSSVGDSINNIFATLVLNVLLSDFLNEFDYYRYERKIAEAIKAAQNAFFEEMRKEEVKK